MKSFVKRFKSQVGLACRQAGFTLIELLVVIGILGILAASLVATIDPFEQLKKANDANTKNILVEFINATVRYYTTHTAFPWGDSTKVACYNGGTNPSKTPLAHSSVYPSTQMDNTTNGCIKVLTDDNELKKAFGSAQQLPLIFVTYDSSKNSVIGCFQPSSKSQQNDVNTKYDATGTEGTKATTCAFNSDGTPTDLTKVCFWCTQ